MFTRRLKVTVSEPFLAELRYTEYTELYEPYESNNTVYERSFMLIYTNGTSGFKELHDHSQ